MKMEAVRTYQAHLKYTEAILAELCMTIKVFKPNLMHYSDERKQLTYFYFTGTKMPFACPNCIVPDLPVKFIIKLPNLFYRSEPICPPLFMMCFADSR